MLQKIKNQLINKIITNPIQVLIISLSLTVLIVLGVTNFKIEDDLMKAFPQKLPSKIIWEEIKDNFGETEFIFIAFGRNGHDMLRDTAAIKASQLFTEALDSIETINKVISLSTFNKISGSEYELDFGLLQDEDFLYYLDNNDTININRVLDEIEYYFIQNSDHKQRLISYNNEYLSIAARPINGFDLSKVVPDIKRLANYYLDDYEIHFAGQPYLSGETPNMIKKDVSILMMIGIFIMLVILFINLRSFYAVVMIILTIALSFMSMIGFMGWMRFLTGTIYFDFTMMNTSMPIILLTIANSDGVHVVSRFFREFRASKNQTNAIRSTMDNLIQPICITSLTTAVAFITMISSPIEYMVGYAFGIAFGVLWALFLSCTMLPALISIKRWDLNSKAVSNQSILEKLTNSLGKLVVSHPKKILSSSLLIVILSLVGVTYLIVEVNISKFYKKGNPIRESTVFIDNNFNGTMNLSIALDYDLTKYENYLMLYELQLFLESNNQITTTFSFADVLNESYKAYTGAKSDFIPDQDQLDGTYSMLAYSDKGNLDDDLVSFLGKDYDPYFDNVDKALVTAMIKTISTTEVQNLINQVEEYLDIYIADSNQVKISGLSVFINEFVDVILKSSLMSICLSILLILIITGLFFKSFKWGILSIIPLTSAVILNFGLMGLSGIHLNHMTALLSSVIIGVGVDFSIHYVSDYRKKLIKYSFSKDLNFKTIKDVGYPILLDVASNMGFIALLFSALIPLNHMGGLMVLAMLSTSFGTLTILASFIQLLNIKKV